MEASTQFNLLHIVTITSGFLAVFQAILGVSYWAGLGVSLIFVICLWSTRRLMLRAIKRGEHIFPPATSTRRRKHRWLFPLVLVAFCFGLPFVPPDVYGGGLALPLRERIIIGGAIYVLLSTITVIRLRFPKDLTMRSS